MAPPETISQDLLSWADPQLKQRLLADPFVVLREQGINVPNNLPLKIVHEVVRIVFLLWVEGKIVPRDRFHIDPNDEGLLFGRGLWESTQTVGGVPWLWDLHLDRLRRTAALLEIDVPLERLPDSKQVSDYVRSLCGTDVLIRLNVTAGRPGKPGLKQKGI